MAKAFLCLVSVRVSCQDCRGGWAGRGKVATPPSSNAKLRPAYFNSDGLAGAQTDMCPSGPPPILKMVCHLRNTEAVLVDPRREEADRMAAANGSAAVAEAVARADCSHCRCNFGCRCR